MRFAQAFNIDYEVNLSFKVLVFLFTAFLLLRWNNE